MELIEKQEAIHALKAIRHGLWGIDIPHPGNCPEYIEHHRQISAMIGNVDGWIRRLTDMPSAQPEYTEQDVREAFNSGYSCGMEAAASVQPENTERTAKTTQNAPNDDLISRKMAIDALSTPHGILYPIRTVEELPSAQPEIIRCRDCRWRKDQSGSTAWLPCRAIVTPSDFYCGRAERRTDGSD